jgi:hypothetical protein
MQYNVKSCLLAEDEPTDTVGTKMLVAICVLNTTNWHSGHSC